jgi:hypothetical protein
MAMISRKNRCWYPQRDSLIVRQRAAKRDCWAFSLRKFRNGLSTALLVNSIKPFSCGRWCNERVATVISGWPVQSSTIHLKQPVKGEAGPSVQSPGCAHQFPN